MLSLKFVSEITDVDVLDNISEDCKALLIDEDDFWIEILKDGSFYISDGWGGDKTTNILEAANLLNEFKIKNS